MRLRSVHDSNAEKRSRGPRQNRCRLHQYVDRKPFTGTGSRSAPSHAVSEATSGAIVSQLQFVKCLFGWPAPSDFEPAERCLEISERSPYSSTLGFWYSFLFGFGADS